VGTSRTRNNATVANYVTHQRLFNSAGVQQSDYVQNLNMFDYWYCADEVNEMALMGKYPYDIGGPLLSLKVQHEFPVYSDYASGSAFGLRWTNEGPLIAYPSYAIKGADLSSAWKTEAQSNLDSIATRIGLGATAISRARPAQPQASLSVSIAEAYREGIPNTLRQLASYEDEVKKFKSLYRDLGLSKRRYTALKRAGTTIPSKYLEFEFGWKPLVADIQKTTRSLMKFNQIQEDLRRNSGKRIRRSYSFPEVTSETLLVSDSTRPWASPNTYILSQAGGRKVTRTDSKKTWFHGEFVYMYPTSHSSISAEMIHGSRQLLGLDLTPETVWNVAPWTWLVDWFSNVGDVVSNATAIGADNLILRYGYLMQEAKRTYRHEHFGVSIQSGVLKSPHIVGSTVYTAKSRIGASPFGFGLTWDQLDPRQIAILTSIGITRRGRH
jgi:hypothetical protein